MAAANQTSEEAQLRACEEYCQTHNIQKLVKDAIVQLCIHKPTQPISFLKDHFAQLELHLQVGNRLKFFYHLVYILNEKSRKFTLIFTRLSYVESLHVKKTKIKMCSNIRKKQIH